MFPEASQSRGVLTGITVTEYVKERIDTVMKDAELLAAGASSVK